MSRCTHRLRRPGRTAGLQPTRVVRPAAALILAAVLCWSIPGVDAGAAPATIRHPAPATIRHVDVDDTLRALDRLHQFGYSIDTAARAGRAIRHWQRANGLTVDGIVGAETLASLNLPIQTAAPAPAPAVRLTPAPPATDVETIIRQAWPDDLEDHALQIAMRESRLQPGARNACCYGLFQIHWGAHHSWLAELGITSPNQLLDAATNAAAAYALYQRDGWAPWRL